jgi:hypothetical protein
MMIWAQAKRPSNPRSYRIVRVRCGHRRTHAHRFVRPLTRINPFLSRCCKITKKNAILIPGSERQKAEEYQIERREFQSLREHYVSLVPGGRAKMLTSLIGRFELMLSLVSVYGVVCTSLGRTAL